MDSAILYVIERLGIPESDIRSVTAEFSEDVFTVRLWNRRRIRVTGIEVFRW